MSCRDGWIAVEGVDAALSQKTPSAAASQWVERLEKAKSKLATVLVVAALYQELMPDAGTLAALIEKLVTSNKS